MSEHREPDDDALGQLLAEGLGRLAAGPVDDGDLLAGARRGAARIRRRRRAALTVASVLVIGSPVGLAASELMGSSQPSHITSATGLRSASPMLGQPAPTGDAATALQDTAQATAPGERIASFSVPATGGTSAPEVAAGAPQVPDAALLTAADLRAATLRQTSDTSYLGPVPASAPADTCGTALDPVPAALGRARVFERRTGSSEAWWLLGNTVRVLAGDGAREYAAAGSGLGCVTGVVVPGTDLAVVGHGGPDAQGRTHWYAGARVGRVVTEVRLVVPSGSGITRTDVAGLLTSAAKKVTSSGLVAAAAADPALS
jgi:hypothetical protein